jgi:DNA invertase Pin-like site-specific DNA recombinase
MRVIGYARVSTKPQDLTSQRQTLEAAGCTTIYAEKISGKDDKRPKLQRMLKELQPGDVVIVTSLDRLARSTRDLLNIVQVIADAGAQFKSLRESWDTTTPHGKLLLTIVGAIAEFERSLILGRTQAIPDPAGHKAGQHHKLKLGRSGDLAPRHVSNVAVPLTADKLDGPPQPAAPRRFTLRSPRRRLAERID